MFASTKFFLSKQLQNQISAPKPKNSNLEDLEDYEKPKKI
jgi:hypothetical protein